MKFKLDKKKFKENIVGAVAGAAGFIGASYGKNMLAPHVANYGGGTYVLDGIAVVAGVGLAASANGQDQTAKAVRGAGIGIATNGVTSFVGRQIGKYMAKKQKGTNGPARVIRLNAPEVPAIELGNDYPMQQNEKVPVLATLL